MYKIRRVSECDEGVVNACLGDTHTRYVVKSFGKMFSTRNEKPRQQVASLAQHSGVHEQSLRQNRVREHRSSTRIEKIRTFVAY